MPKGKEVSVSKKTKDTVSSSELDELEQRIAELDHPDFFGKQHFIESDGPTKLLDEDRATTKLLRLENRLSLYESQLRSKSEPIEQSGSRAKHLKRIEDLKKDIAAAKDRIRADETMEFHAEKWMES